MYLHFCSKGVVWGYLCRKLYMLSFFNSVSEFLDSVYQVYVTVTIAKCVIQVK